MTIRFDYTNNETRTVKIDGKEHKIKVPFGMVSGVILPNENFSNIQVTNGKVISDGQNNIVVGAAFPSLRESLDIDALKEDTSSEDVKKKLEDLDIPEYVEITADAENFKLDTTMTAAVANLLNMVTLSLRPCRRCLRLKRRCRKAEGRREDPEEWHLGSQGWRV